jgi:integrase
MKDIRSLPVTTLTVVQLRDLVADEAPTFYPARDIKTLLSKILTLAIADQQITINLADYIVLPKLNEKEQTPWNEDELKTIWTAFDEGDVISSYMLLMIYTGMMPGELDKCLRSMIKLDERQIIGAGIKTNVRKSAPIVIAELIVPVIERILTYTEDNPDRRILYTDRWSFYDAYHEFNRSRGIRDLPMYSCRHTTATALAVGTDVAPSIIQKIMRHAKFTTTQRYIHPDSSDALAGVNKLSR